jgi:hypothetical protein
MNFPVFRSIATQTPETDDALETAQFFLNTLSDLAQGRAMLLHRQ